MKHLMNTKTEKLTRRGFAFLLALVLTTSAFVPGLTARATEEPTDAVLTGETTPTTVPTEATTVSTEETTAPTEETTAPTEETTAPSEETTAPTEETTASPEEATVPTEGDDEIPEEDSNGAVEEIPYVGETFVRMTRSVPVVRSATEITSPTFSKTATLRDDGNYDLKVSISGAFSEEAKDTEVDVILIIDRSLSMTSNSLKENRFEDAIVAATTLVNSINSNDNISANYRFITFEGRWEVANGHTRDFNTVSGWISDAGDAVDWINSIPEPYNQAATNYEVAFEELRDALPNPDRENATKVVIFLTDGAPTMRNSNPDNKSEHKALNYIGDDGKAIHYYGTAREGDENIKRCLAAAVAEIADIEMDRFYAVATGTATEANLTAVANAALKAKSKAVLSAKSSQLSTLFSNIAQEILSFYCEDVTVVDQLKHIDGQLVVDVVEPKEVYVTVYNDGSVVKSGIGHVTLDIPNGEPATITATYDSEKHQMILDFPDDYKLEKTYTYEISMVIKATEKAYREYREKLKYVDRGELETGTHSDQLGIQCNDWAKATYTYIDQPITAEYHYPVIQLLPGTLVVGKSFDGLTEEQIASIEDLVFDVTLTYPDDGNGVDDETVTEQIPFSDMKKGDDGIYTYAIYGLSPETKYSVTESGGTVADYDQTTSWVATCEADCEKNCTDHKGQVGPTGTAAKTVSGTVDKGATVNVAYTNAYTIAIAPVTVEKQVTGNMGDINKLFKFTASLTDGSMKDIIYTRNGSSDENTITTDSFEFELKDDDYITFKNLPLSSELVVTEVSDSYIMTAKVDDKKVDVNNNSVKLTVSSAEGHRIDVNNDYTVTIDTGIALDTVPYILILGAVAMASFLFLRKRRVED